MNSKYKPIKASEVIISQLMLPSHTNFNGKIHGGYLLSLMDQIAFACASKHSETYCVTASVEAVDFLNPIEVGEIVTLKASVNYVGNSSMIVGIRVTSENIQTGQKKHCNSSYFTMVAKSDSGKSVQVPGLILSNDNEVRRFVRGLTRHELRIEYNNTFEHKDFASHEYLDKLKDYRVKIDL